MIKTCALIGLLVLSGCATLPTGPSVMVLPGTTKPFEQFQADDAACRQWAESQVGPPGAALTHDTATGATLGTLLGAGLGAAIGAAAAASGIGAAIGAASGLLLGSSIGLSSDQGAGWSAQQRYDAAYVQCMYAKGNQVPGVVNQGRASRSVPPPPPPSSSGASAPQAPVTGTAHTSGNIPPPPPGTPPAPPPGL